MVAPSAVPFSPETVVPKAMTKEDINKFKQDWAAAVKRALEVGFDVSSGTETPNEVHKF